MVGSTVMLSACCLSSYPNKHNVLMHKIYQSVCVCTLFTERCDIIPVGGDCAISTKLDNCQLICARCMCACFCPTKCSTTISPPCKGNLPWRLQSSPYPPCMSLSGVLHIVREQACTLRIEPTFEALPGH